MWKIACKPLMAGLLLLLPGLLMAHDARPLFVQIDEQETHGSSRHVYQVTVRTPPTVETNNRPSLSLPNACQQQSLGQLIQLQCATALQGQTLTVQWPQHNPSITTLIRVNLSGGESYQQLLSPSANSWQVPTDRSTLDVASDYSLLGIEHILIGWDHLLFLICLIWIAGTFKRMLITISGFTLAHSLTLALTTLGYVSLPIAPVEAVIALSILFLAVEIVRDRRDTLAWRYPVAVSTLFGLIHGFGFASVLKDIGLPQNDLGTALLYFNIGVEIGQVLFVSGIMATFALLKRIETFPLAQVQAVMVYGVGTLAAFWTLERVAGF